MRKILREFRVELIALGVVALGIFLLVEQFDIRVTLYRWVTRFFKALSGIYAGIKTFIFEYLTTFTLSDAVGLLMVMGTLLFFAWRLRWRFMRSRFYTSDVCPKCGAELERVHRTWADKALETISFLKFHRYRCANRCGWEGLRKPLHGGKRLK